MICLYKFLTHSLKTKYSSFALIWSRTVSCIFSWNCTTWYLKVRWRFYRKGLKLGLRWSGVLCNSVKLARWVCKAAVGPDSSCVRHTSCLGSSLNTCLVYTIIPCFLIKCARNAGVSHCCSGLSAPRCSLPATQQQSLKVSRSKLKAQC